MAQLSANPNAAKDGDKPVKMQSQGKSNQVLQRKEVNHANQNKERFSRNVDKA